MRFDIITLFPESISPYFEASILKKARQENQIEVRFHQLRDFAFDKHKTVDDTPYGGGAGMVLKAEPVALAIEHVKSLAPDLKTRTILFAAKGSLYTQAKAREFSETYERLILVCGRYEGVDERVSEHFVDEEVSIGEYVLTGGEIAALVVADSVSRLLPGVLGNIESIVEESHSESGVLEYPQYTKPEVFRDFKVPETLLSGNHEAIAKWRKEHSKKNT
ncbi:MAG: tRNA (guanosine(37)-N1)-methyltransferase TrmD [Candidatus Moranbacteria bacterium RIFCSPHIGHO2_01_FULL_55_24]|nr:MAG: tRNA (guanosine(37)-N1)-methyltransferase TrmD [Candidatus Moranbacteria bacterium RIFCSPHIGHO2_01_FULL_55_24]